MTSVRRLLVLFSVVMAGVICQSQLTFAQADKTKVSSEFRGRTLKYWVSQATAENGPSDLDETVVYQMKVVE